MPEGQISHRNARDFTRALAGLPVTRVWTDEPRIIPQRIPERLAGDTVTGAEARGKHHLLRFGSGRVLHSHLMISGVWRLVPDGHPVRPGGLFLAIQVPGWTAALHRCPNVRLLEPGEPLPTSLQRLGPDLLGAGADPAADAVRALRRADAGRQVGDAVMDQRVMAGIGNVYKSETLFLAGVDPWRAVGSLTDDECARIGGIAAELLEGGVRDRGRITTYEAPGPRRGRAMERTWVYGRRGRPCRRCGAPVLSRGQGDANRTAYWCPVCQT